MVGVYGLSRRALGRCVHRVHARRGRAPPCGRSQGQPHRRRDRELVRRAHAAPHVAVALGVGPAHARVRRVPGGGASDALCRRRARRMRCSSGTRRTRALRQARGLRALLGPTAGAQAPYALLLLLFGRSKMPCVGFRLGSARARCRCTRAASSRARRTRARRRRTSRRAARPPHARASRPRAARVSRRRRRSADRGGPRSSHNPGGALRGAVAEMESWCFVSRAVSRGKSNADKGGSDHTQVPSRSRLFLVYYPQTAWGCCSFATNFARLGTRGRVEFFFIGWSSEITHLNAPRHVPRPASALQLSVSP